MCSFNLTDVTAACNSNRAIERRPFGDTLRFAMTNFKSAEYSFGNEGRLATAHIVSSDASANT